MIRTLKQARGYVFGHDRQGREFQVGEKERAAHMHVIGASGTGKSKFLERLIRQDLRNRKVGACVIDPHGALVDDVMDYVAHRAPHLAKRVVLFEPASQTDWITGFNPIPGESDSMSNTVDSIVESILFAWGQSENDYPRIKTWPYNILYLVVANRLTLVEALPVLNIHAKDARRSMYKRIGSESSVRKDWEDFETLPTREKVVLLEGMQNRLRRLLNNEFMRRVFSQQNNALDMARIMDDKKILLVSLRDHNRIHRENLRMLGIMILKEIYRVGMQRVERKRPPAFHAYIDEFGQYITPVVADALDEIRKKNVFFTVAHQHLSQLENDEMGKQILSSVMTNCRLKVAFGGLTPYDADQMSKLMWTGKYNLYKHKHRQWGTKVRTNESTRTSYTEGSAEAYGEQSSTSDGQNWSNSVSDGQTRSATNTITEGEQQGWTQSNAQGRSDASNWSSSTSRGTNESETNSQSYTDGTTNTRGRSQAEMNGTNQSRTLNKSKTISESQTDAYGHSYGETTTSNFSRSTTRSDQHGRSVTYGEEGKRHGTTENHGTNVTTSTQEGGSKSATESHTENHSKTRGQSATEGESNATGSSHSLTNTLSESESTQHSDTTGSSYQRGENSSETSSHGGVRTNSQVRTQGKSGGTSYTEARAQSEGTTHTESHMEGGNKSETKGTSRTKTTNKSQTVGVYDEKEEYKEITGVTLWTAQKLQLMQQGKLMNLPTGVALMKNANGTPTYVKVPRVQSVTKTERGSMRLLARAEARMLSANAEYYAPLDLIQEEAELRQIKIFGEPLRLDEQNLEDGPVLDHEDTGEDIFNTS